MYSEMYDKKHFDVLIVCMYLFVFSKQVCSVSASALPPPPHSPRPATTFTSEFPLGKTEKHLAKHCVNILVVCWCTHSCLVRSQLVSDVATFVTTEEQNFWFTPGFFHYANVSPQLLLSHVFLIYCNSKSCKCLIQLFDSLFSSFLFKEVFFVFVFLRINTNNCCWCCLLSPMIAWSI